MQHLFAPSRAGQTSGVVVFFGVSGATRSLAPQLEKLPQIIRTHLASRSCFATISCAQSAWFLFRIIRCAQQRESQAKHRIWTGKDGSKDKLQSKHKQTHTKLYLFLFPPLSLSLSLPASPLLQTGRSLLALCAPEGGGVYIPHLQLTSMFAHSNQGY